MYLLLNYVQIRTLHTYWYCLSLYVGWGTYFHIGMYCMYYTCFIIFLHVLVGIRNYYVLVCIVTFLIYIGGACIHLD